MQNKLYHLDDLRRMRGFETADLEGSLATTGDGLHATNVAETAVRLRALVDLADPPRWVLLSIPAEGGEITLSASWSRERPRGVEPASRPAALFTAESERADVVAWLRELAARQNAPYGHHANAADTIERGEHVGAARRP